MDYIINGLSNRFRIGFPRHTHLKSLPRNHLSSLANPTVIIDSMSSKLSSSHLIGPLHSSCLLHIQISPIGMVPKSHSSAQWCMKVDLSAPAGHSINNGINAERCSLKYASVNDAVGLIRQLGPGTSLVKMNIKDAYHIIPIHPDDQHLLTVSWGNEAFVNRALPFSLRSALSYSLL